MQSLTSGISQTCFERTKTCCARNCPSKQTGFLFNAPLQKQWEDPRNIFVKLKR